MSMAPGRLSLKVSILGILVAIFSLIFFGAMARSLLNPELKDTWFWVRALLVFGIFSGFLATTFALLPKRRLFAVLALLPIFVFWLHLGFNIVSLVAGGIVFVIFSGYFERIKREKAELLHISMRRYLRHGASGFVMGILIFLSVIYFYTPQVQIQANNLIIPESFQKAVEQVTLYFLREVKTENGQPAFEQNAQLPVAVKAVSNQLAGSFEEILRPYRKFFPLIISAGFFLALSAFTFIWIWLTIGFAALFFLILKKLQFIKVEQVQKEAEIIHLS